MVLALLGGEVGNNGFANPVVVGLDLVLAGRSARRRRASAACRSIRLFLPSSARPAACKATEGSRGRPATAITSSEPPALGQGRHPSPDQAVQRQVGVAGLHRLHQLPDEKRIAARLSGFSTSAAWERRDRLRRAVGRPGPELPRRSRRPAAAAPVAWRQDLGLGFFGECAKEGAGVAVLGPEAGEQEQRGRFRGQQQVRQHQGTVHVTPLQVIEMQDQLPTPADAGQHFAQGREKRHRRSSCGSGKSPAFRWDSESGFPRRPPRRFSQRRKDADQGPDPIGQQGGRLGKRQVSPEPAQAVHQAVEGLVGHRRA